MVLHGLAKNIPEPYYSEYFFGVASCDQAWQPEEMRYALRVLAFVPWLRRFLPDGCDLEWYFLGTCRHTSVFVWMFWPQGAIMGASASDLLSRTIAHSATAVIVKLWSFSHSLLYIESKPCRPMWGKQLELEPVPRTLEGQRWGSESSFIFSEATDKPCEALAQKHMQQEYTGSTEECNTVYQNAVLSDDVEHFSGTRNTTCRSTGAKLSAI